MSTKEIGNYGEDKACEFLIDKKYKILDRNWKIRWCEIDIICIKNNTVYFVEVKYRKNNLYGDGFDAITPNKMKQIHFAAEMWINQNKWIGDFIIAIISVSPSKIEYVEL